MSFLKVNYSLKLTDKTIPAFKNYVQCVSAEFTKVCGRVTTLSTQILGHSKSNTLNVHRFPFLKLTLP